MKYVAPEMKVLELAATDVIVCSGGSGGTGERLPRQRQRFC